MGELCQANPGPAGLDENIEDVERALDAANAIALVEFDRRP
ncbi:MAG: hypothetical protein M5U27_16500 [Gaiella sp.]|nr:hypothetical protein [Gaiella sp.]